MGERTGSRVFQWVWSYVLALESKDDYTALRPSVSFQYIPEIDVISSQIELFFREEMICVVMTV
ncbi:hypothetical protein CTRU02_206187 [Colletotrichum truncatum]|uniref:Uncharacterized protein n=1 Tax=Colletotrichum truncatum TaxID=5467 RepID=A0ACC3Z644_COLTU